MLGLRIQLIGKTQKDLIEGLEDILDNIKRGIDNCLASDNSLNGIHYQFDYDVAEYPENIEVSLCDPFPTTAKTIELKPVPLKRV